MSTVNMAQPSGPVRSSCSSDTGDVLIRSTRVQRHGAEEGSGPVQITVQKLHSPPRVQPHRDGLQRAPQKAGPPRREAADCEPGHELLTSRFTAGGRGAVLAALKQRSHSAPHRREVPVQLFDPLQASVKCQDPPGLSSQDASDVALVQTGPALVSGHQGETSNTPAAAAVIKVCVQAPSDMEARVSRLADGVQKLLEADRGWNQALQQMKTLQSRQLQLQSQLLESNLKTVGGHAPTASDLTASGQPGRLQATHLTHTGSSQQQSFSANTMETSPVAMETCCRDPWPKQSRDGRILRGASDRLETRASELLMEMGGMNPEVKNQSSQTRHQQNQHQQNQSSQTRHQQTQHQQNQSSQTRNQQTQHQQKHFPFQHSHSQQNLSQSHQNQTQQSQSVLVQRRPVVPSMLEEAGQVLRHVRRQKKLLEENLETLLRAETGGVLHCQLEALATNRDCTQEVRIKKTVDAWINTLARDIKAEMSSQDAADAVVTSQHAAGVSSTQIRRGKPMSRPRGAGTGARAGRGSRGPTAAHRLLQEAEPDGVAGRLTDSKQVVVEGESYLTHLYGRAPYEGLRRTLKKSPYLHFSSPASPLSRKPRPRLVESVQGVKLKSCKTQTSISSGPPQHLFSSGGPAHLTTTRPVSVAIPLGPPRMDSSSRAGLLQEVVLLPEVPPVTEDDGASGQQRQQLDADEAAVTPPAPMPAPPPSAPPPPHTVDIINMESEKGVEEEENILPGTDVLSAVDVVQEETSVPGEEAVELDGGPSPPPVLYQGPLFPPQAPCALPAQDPVLRLNQRSVLENRLVEWVEQQLMAQMISDIHRPPPPDPAQNHSSDQSQLEERSVTSDIVEAAGGGGLQLFVDSSLSVDSELIRELVNEVLTETITLMLGQRDTRDTEPEEGLEPAAAEPAAPEPAAPEPAAPEPAAAEPAAPEPAAPEPAALEPAAYQEATRVSTPVPTPPPSLAPPSREATPIITPPPSEPTSPLNEEPQPITMPATPTPSPEPVSAGSPPAPHQPPPTNNWDNAELPLEEERPEEERPEAHTDTHHQLLVMSVAQEEPPLASPVSPPSPPPPPEPRPASPCISSEDSTSSSSSSSSSSAVTAGTETALRPISEGELLISVNQLAAMTEEATVCSFSSSLQELQDMDLDPPSEGQVKGHNLLHTRVEQGATLRERRPEGSWGREEEKEVSVGEVPDHLQTTVSPGQISRCADPTHTHGRTAEEVEEQGGTRRMEVHLPSQGEVMELAASGDTDCFNSDVF
ncbi:protein TALPID3-like [Parambassis ranga]|uniref:Protein TALPID3-like n=1 Tax=Parambassis ranga TaxID=210632 RepID=A0A6P7HJ29_9TELE|nr:protein TALPID3-like [Parambassis ranga]